MHFVNAKGILSAQNGMNIYRGCTHGCIYCDARSDCYQMPHQFEDIEIKINAPQLLEEKLRHKRKKCMIGTGAMSDPYLHYEKELKLTQKCLEIIDKYGFGATIQTKSNMILRDLELLKSINQKSKCVVQMTLTTYDENLCKIIEPNVCTTYERYKTLKILNQNNIPTVVWISPILPYINDTKENLNGLLNYCFDANVKGIICFGMGVTLRSGDREYFYSALDKNFKGLKEKYIHRYGDSYECASDNQKELMNLLYDKCKANNTMCDINDIFNYLHYFPEQDNQLSFF